MPAIYCADVYCDSCADKIREDIRRELGEQIDKLKNELAENVVPGQVIALNHEIERIENRLANFDDEHDYDSDEFPKYMADDEESDSPQHCGSGADCLELVELDDGTKIGALLSDRLTTDGVGYVTEQIANGGIVAEFWKNEFERSGYDFDSIEIVEKSSGWDDFWQGYCDALCFTAHDDSDSGNSLFPAQGEFTDFWDGENEIVRLLSADELTELKNDAANFFLEARRLIAGRESEAGADFHYTRNGHGTGFWDGDWPDTGDELTKMSKPYGSCELMGRIVDGEQCDVFVCH